MKLEVECYSGRKADERPVRFRLDGRQYLVEEVLDQYGRDDEFFKVCADDGNLIYTAPRIIGSGGWLASGLIPAVVVSRGWRS